MTATPIVPETVTRTQPPHTHTRADDAQGIAFGAVMAAFSAFLLGSAGHTLAGGGAPIAVADTVSSLRSRSGRAVS